MDAIYFTASSRSDAAATIDIYLLATDRADWLALQRTPAPEGSISHATRCWIVTASSDVAAVDDVPSGWGLLVAELPGADDLFTVAKRPHTRRAVIDAPLLLALLTNQRDSYVQRNAGIRTQYKRHAERHAPGLFNGSATMSSSTGSASQNTAGESLNGVSGRNSLPTKTEGGHLPAGLQHPGHGQPPLQTPQDTTSGPRTAQVLPARPHLQRTGEPTLAAPAPMGTSLLTRLRARTLPPGTRRGTTSRASHTHHGGSASSTASRT
ncbi:hypothetical protein [Streptomyces sp. NPDC001165]|uniref:hypothetical protein n=1 Tax=Streptomyces sp. NPDC001165 TaxID=3364546 RepID=UPI003689BFB0